jgi:eukaryotic-like serine/threonine-protein kinase
MPPVNGDETLPLEDEDLALLLASWDEVLAAGVPPASLSLAPAPPLQRPRAERHLACMQLLRQLWPATPPADGSPDPAEPPATLGRFQVRRELGRGGYGVVLLAYDPQLRREVALKVPLAPALVNPELRQRFRQEAQAAAGLDHPNIVSVYEAGEAGPVCYIASAYCPGITLADWLKARTEPVPVRTAALLLTALANAVHHAHSRGVLHRDLKPANILLEETGEDADGSPRTPIPKITDFGLAKLLEGTEHGLTRSGAIVGTPNYMAPEQACGRTREVTTAVDIYALGVLLYEILTGRPPFEGTTPLETLRKVESEEPVSPGRLRPRLPHDLETICLKCLQKEPHRRYPSAAALAEDLRRFLDGEPVLARPVALWERSLRWAQRRPAAAALVAVSVVAVLSLCAGGLWYNAELRDALQAATDRREEAVQERARAFTSLYHALIREAEANRLARGSGYRVRAWARLADALQMETPDKDVRQLRHEAVACLGDFAGLEPSAWQLPAGDIDSIAVHPDGRRLALGLRDGTVLEGGAGATPTIALLRGHNTAVHALAYAADGQRLVTQDKGGTIKVWQPDAHGTWTCTQTLAAQRPDLDWDRRQTSLALTTDGRFLAVCSAGASPAQLWDLSAGTPIASFPMAKDQRLHCLALSPDGKLLAAGYHQRGPGTRGVLVWDVPGGRLKGAILPALDYPRQVAFSPDGKWLASACGDGGVLVCDTTDFRQRLQVQGNNPVDLAFSPDSQLLAILSGHTGAVHLWHLAVTREVAVLDHPSQPHAVEFTKDGKALVVAEDRAVRVWNLQGSQEKRVLAGHSAGIPSLAFSPDGRRLASAGKDGTVKLWDSGSGSIVRTLTGFRGPVQTLAFSPDGRLLATGDWGGAIRVWEVATGRELAAPEHPLGNDVWGLAFSPNGRYFAACGDPGGVALWRLRAGEPRLAWQRPFRLAEGTILGLLFSPDSRLLAWPDAGGLRLWDLEGGRPATTALPAALGTVYNLAFRAGDRELVVIGQSLVPEVWDLTTGRRAFALTATPVGSGTALTGRAAITLSADGIWLAQGGPAVRVWDLQRRELLFALPKERSLPWSFAWSPDRRLLAVGTSDGELAIWDVERMRTQLAELGLAW